MPEEPSNGRVTQKDLYDAIMGVYAKLDEVSVTLRSEMKQTYAVSAVCEQKHERVDAMIEALASASKQSLEDAVSASKSDRDQIWEAVHGLQSLVNGVTRWLIVTAVGAFVSLVIAIALALVTRAL